MSIDITTLKSRSGYGFLLVFYSNFVSNMHHIFEILDFKNAVTLKTGSGDR